MTLDDQSDLMMLGNAMVDIFHAWPLYPKDSRRQLMLELSQGGRSCATSADWKRAGIWFHCS